ncbi:unnamed protein product [Ectocarpus fasciculatus]
MGVGDHGTYPNARHLRHLIPFNTVSFPRQTPRMRLCVEYAGRRNSRLTLKVPRAKEGKTRRGNSPVPRKYALAPTEFLQNFDHYVNDVGSFHPTWREASEELRSCLRELEEKNKKENAAEDERREGLLRTARNHKCLEQWKLAISDYQSYLNDVGIHHPTWHEAADELDECRWEVEEEQRVKAVEEERKKVEYEKRKELLRKARNHTFLEQWELAITDFHTYLRDGGVSAWLEAADDLEQCHQKIEEQERLKAAEEERKKVEDEKQKELLRTARNRKGEEQWESATSDYQSYLNNVGVCHQTWHEAADELDECRQKVEEKRAKAAEEKRKKVEDKKRKELLRKARSHKCLGQWESAITDYLHYLNDVGDSHPTSHQVAEELDHCRQEQAKVRASEEKRKVEEERRRKAAEEAAQEEAAREEGKWGGHYATLWVRSNAQPREIKEAYRKLALRHHPDKNPGDSNAARRFRAINQAYEVLKDEEARRVYNRKLDGEQRTAHNRRYDDFMRRRTAS